MVHKWHTAGAYLPFNIVVVYMHLVRALRLVWRGGARSVALPTERAFILGLSEPTQGEIVGRWSETTHTHRMARLRLTL